MNLVFGTNPDFGPRDFGVDVRILDSRQRPVAFMSSLEMLSRYFSPGETVRCEVETLTLAPGTYTVDIGASIPRIEAMDSWLGEVSFDISRFDPFDSGSTFMPNDHTGHVVPLHRWSADRAE